MAPSCSPEGKGSHPVEKANEKWWRMALAEPKLTEKTNEEKGRKNSKYLIYD